MSRVAGDIPGERYYCLRWRETYLEIGSSVCDGGRYT